MVSTWDIRGDCEFFDAHQTRPIIPDLFNRLLRGRMSVQEFLHQAVTSHPVVLFMKGTPQFPQCGFSATAVQVLKACGVTDIHSINVLDDAEVRQGAKDYANWPTFPQLFIKGQFVGGADIMREMYQSGELQRLLA